MPEEGGGIVAFFGEGNQKYPCSICGKPSVIQHQCFPNGDETKKNLNTFYCFHHNNEHEKVCKGATLNVML